MRVLVACEYSGTVRDAFSLKGHDAWSCDLLPSESLLTNREGKHIQCNVLEVLGDGWDLLIGHPPCTYISYAGTQFWNTKGRVFKRLEALRFFAELWEAPIPYICLENPKSCASPIIAKYSQEIQPYYFGDAQLKTTWLWLKNLPLLKYSSHDNLFIQKTSVGKPQPLYVDKSGKKRHFTDSIGHSPKQAKIRAKFWPGVAKAMAEQWGNINQMEGAA